MGSRSDPAVSNEDDVPSLDEPERIRKRRNVFSYVALLPAAILVLGLMVLPIGETMYHSFTNWDGVTSKFIGLTNFDLIFHDAIIRQVFVNSLIFLISVPLILAASLVTAVLVYEKVLGWRVFRFLFFIQIGRAHV